MGTAIYLRQGVRSDEVADAHCDLGRKPPTSVLAAPPTSLLLTTPSNQGYPTLKPAGSEPP